MIRPLAHVAAVAALVAAILFAGSAPASAKGDSGDSDVTVSVPAATPRPTSPGGGVPRPPSSPGTAASTTAPATGGAKTTPAAPAEGAGATVCIPAEPALPEAPATDGGAATTANDVYYAGETVNASAGGFGAAEQVQLVLFSEPTLVGNFAADASGSITAQFPLPDDILAGTHTLQFTGWCGHTATVEVIVGSHGTPSSASVQGIPTWVWWAGGGVGALALIGASWWVLTAMRAPAGVPA